MRILLTALLLLLASSPLAVAQESAYRVIVNTENEVATAERKFLSEAFLKKTTRWPDGELIRPVDLAPGSATRRRFTQDVVGRTVAAVKSYWQQIIFSGRGVPPPELDDDAQVVEYVRRHRGAVGYVSPNADVGGVKVLAIK